MSSSTIISNMALSHLGISARIADLTTERSKEANACELWFEIMRDATLRDFAWGFASKIVTLGLVEEDPNDEWLYSYRYPSDCLEIRKILSGIRNDTRQSKVPYILGADSSGTLIFTDTADAQLKYTYRHEDYLRYPPDLLIAMSLRLATYIAPELTGGDPFKLGDRSMQKYLIHMAKARASAINEEQAEEAPDSEFIRARE